MENVNTKVNFVLEHNMSSTNKHTVALRERLFAGIVPLYQNKSQTATNFNARYIR